MSVFHTRSQGLTPSIRESLASCASWYRYPRCATKKSCCSSMTKRPSRLLNIRVILSMISKNSGLWRHKMLTKILSRKRIRLWRSLRTTQTKITRWWPCDICHPITGKKASRNLSKIPTRHLRNWTKSLLVWERQTFKKILY